MTRIDLLPLLAKSLERYITLRRVVTGDTYDYAKRGMFRLPVIESQRHLPKCTLGESWLYVASPEGAPLDALRDEDRLYLGSQTQDRMFRGDRRGGDNFHHAEMRKGNGADNLVTYLQAGGSVVIHRVASSRIAEVVGARPETAFLRKLADQPRTKRSHPAYWFEQYILSVQAGQWRWNTASASATVWSLLEDAPVAA